MGDTQTGHRRIKLRLSYDGLAASGKRLRDVLYEGLRACDEALSGATPGTFVNSTGEGGGNVSFAMVPGYPPDYARDVFGDLLNDCDACISRLGGDVDNRDSYTDKALYDLMMSRLVKARFLRNDYTGLRCGPGAYAGS